MPEDFSYVREDEHAVPPPLVKGWPIIGNTIPLVTDTLDFLRRTHEEYGDIYIVKAAHHEFVVMAGAEANRFVAEKGHSYLNSGGFWGETLTQMECPHSFIGIDGESHQYQRRLLMPYFAKSKFTHNLPELADIFQQTLAMYYQTKTLVAPFFRHVLSRQIGQTMQGYQPTSNEVEALIRFENKTLNVCSLKKFPRVALKLPQYRAAQQGWNSLAEKIIALEKREGTPGAYLGVVMKEGRNKHPQWFSDGDIRSHANLPFIAGSDTIGAMLCFMLLEVLKQPDIRDLLQKEVDDVFKEGIPDIATLESMENLRNFTREVLRLYPTVYVLRRTATRDFTFKGYLIRKGQQIILFSTSNHTNPAYFKHPYQFDIDRYKEPRSEHRASGALAPFGVGAHTCMGAGAANVLMPLNLAFLLFYTDVKPANDVRRIKRNFSTPAMTLSPRFAIHLAPRGHQTQA